MNRHRRPANELFPGLDWRYLLPDPAPGTVVAVGRGPLAAIAGRLTRRSSAFDPDGADLVVADRANRATLEWAHHLVRPGGSLYVEVPWPRWRQAEVLGRRLTAAGFPDPSLYSLSASRDRWSPSWWIPVGDADAARFVADSNQLQPEDRQSWIGRRRSHLIGWLSRRERLIERHPWLIHPTRRQVLAAVAVKPATAGRETAGPASWRGRRDDPTIVSRRSCGSEAARPTRR